MLAQVVYYFTAALSMGACDRKVSFTVPTGNFGDIFAGYIAREMGLPIADLVIATNQNDILHRCLTTGAYHKGAVHASISPSMDIQVSSNFERALYFAQGQDSDATRALMDDLANGGFDLGDNVLRSLQDTYKSGRVSEEETSATIKEFYANTGELLCPHSAIGVRVAQALRDPATPMITLATAHPAKFPDAVEAATGVRPPLPDHMADLFDRDERVTRVSNDLASLKDIIKGGIAQ